MSRKFCQAKGHSERCIYCSDVRYRQSISFKVLMYKEEHSYNLDHLQNITSDVQHQYLAYYYKLYDIVKVRDTYGTV